MEYKEVSFIKDWSANSMSDAVGRMCQLNIDDNEHLYEIIGGNTRLYLMWGHFSKKYGYYVLPNIELPMNKTNPKETLDRFFKLLLLS